MPFPSQLMKNNYHTHMYLCRHAVGDVNDYVEEAIRLGFTSLGMSDHAPFEELEDRSVRMHPEDLPLYLSKCDLAIEKYKSNIKIYKALEIEYFSKYDGIYKAYLSHLDYLALGQHYIEDEHSLNGLRSTYALTTIEHIHTYVSTVIEAMETGYFKLICHPDLMLYNIMNFDEKVIAESKRLIEAAKRLGIPLEINANGIRKGVRQTKDGLRYLYPRLEFWKIVKAVGAKVIISSDAHDPRYLYDDEVKVAYQFAIDLGIEVEEDIKI